MILLATKIYTFYMHLYVCRFQCSKQIAYFSAALSEALVPAQVGSDVLLRSAYLLQTCIKQKIFFHPITYEWSHRPPVIKHFLRLYLTCRKYRQCRGLFFFITLTPHWIGSFSDWSQWPGSMALNHHAIQLFLEWCLQYVQLFLKDWLAKYINLFLFWVRVVFLFDWVSFDDDE